MLRNLEFYFLTSRISRFWTLPAQGCHAIRTLSLRGCEQKNFLKAKLWIALYMYSRRNRQESTLHSSPITTAMFWLKGAQRRYYVVLLPMLMAPEVDVEKPWSCLLHTSILLAAFAGHTF
ncbi:BTB/POZ domain-containing adapter for CUL3-mediated RhoA degradation protein 2 [Platysternon megacephalum]|uniref:BTB/POZ domain-containing adapter for CUL3-mediated RhoA degradation protein 2 n=1 Tax=Platysternon megacephalum TaxID=55544 RepID=A0A4D9F775_9SAUR|nr:BTB/POZ domain-containing adapter for CUL3-mediated RhoA degradation protein 2 [Platysternon megacephalum]